MKDKQSILLAPDSAQIKHEREKARSNPTLFDEADRERDNPAKESII